MKKEIHNYKAVKVVETTVFVIMELLFLYILIKNKTMRSSIFTDRSLYILCVIAYGTAVFAFATMLYDFVKLKKLKTEAHHIENLAYLDKMTGIPNRTSCNLFFETYKTKESMAGIGCVVTEISNIRDINKANGKEYGDKVISEFTHILEQTAQTFGFVGRNGGNEYITVIRDCSDSTANAFLKMLESEIDSYNKKNGIEILLHSEYVLFNNTTATNFSELLSEVYAKLRNY